MLRKHPLSSSFADMFRPFRCQVSEHIRDFLSGSRR
jgi:hypothetical protein